MTELERRRRDPAGGGRGGEKGRKTPTYDKKSKASKAGEPATRTHTDIHTHTQPTHSSQLGMSLWHSNTQGIILKIIMTS